MATWHQAQARKRNGPPRWQHATEWTVVTDPPGEFASSISFTYRSEAEAYMERRRAAGDTGMFIVPPAALS